MYKICENCGSLNSEIIKTEGGRSVGLFLLLCLFMIIPGLLYWGFAKKEKKIPTCKACGAENKCMEVSTPKGIQLFKQYHPELTPPKVKIGSWHGLW